MPSISFYREASIDTLTGKAPPSSRRRASFVSAYSPSLLPFGQHRRARSVTWSCCLGQLTVAEDLVRFLLSLRHLLRNSFACAVMTIPSVLLRTAQGGPALVRRIEHYADAVVELQSFVSRPDLAALFPRYAGLINIRSLPALNTLVPPSARLSVLKGASGKQDLAFRLKRRRFVVETLHLDVEGGVNERKTPKEEESKMKASDVLGPKKPTFKADKPELYDF